jgi:hypothetical protein
MRRVIKVKPEEWRQSLNDAKTASEIFKKAVNPPNKCSGIAKRQY